MNLSDFHFLRPWWLLALPLLVLLWLRLQRSATRSNWESICDPHLLPFIIGNSSGRRERFRSIALAGGIILTVIALAGPTWQRLPQPVFRQQSALVILLDLSRSMDCTDISPSRLSRARYKITDILRKRNEGQTALVVFAGAAFTVTPLTTDNNTIAALLNSLQTDIMPSQGSRVDLAIEKGQQLISQAGLHRGELLLIGDGIDGPRSLAAAKKLAASGLRLSVLGIGTPEAAPIATGSGFLQDAEGAIVIPKMDAGQLRDLARAGGGTFQQLSVDDLDIDNLLATGDLERLQSEIQQTELMTDRWQDLGPWLLLPLLPLAALAFQRGYLAIFLLCLMLPAKPAQALELTELWSRPDQQAYNDLQRGDAEAAAEKFIDPKWRAVANYRAGRFQQSVDALSSLTDSRSLYNKGNALARLGRYPEAITAYDEVLALEPDNTDAQDNRLLLQKLLQKDEPQQQTKQPNESPAGQLGNENRQDHPEGAEKQSAEQQQQSGSNADEPDANRTAAEKPAEPSNSSETEAKSNATQQQDSTPRPGEEPSGTPLTTPETGDEMESATERWLQQIPDDPGSLLQRKFLYQYNQQQQSGKENPW
ncbi:MAG TPA: VWA domain-containing protein [Malonomonas sp.]